MLPVRTLPSSAWWASSSVPARPRYAEKGGKLVGEKKRTVFTDGKTPTTNSNRIDLKHALWRRRRFEAQRDAVLVAALQHRNVRICTAFDDGAAEKAVGGSGAVQH
jgi:hypothetical protein